MITKPESKLPPPDELAERIATTARSPQVWADAQAVTTALFGKATTANIFVVGMAFQAGLLPISLEKIEEAIELNGVAVESNLAAFGWGRAVISDRDAVDAAVIADAVRVSTGENFPDRLDALEATGERRQKLSRLAGELVAWGNKQHALEWFDVLDRVRTAETRVAKSQTALVLSLIHISEPTRPY